MRSFASFPVVFALIALPWSAQDPKAPDPAGQDPAKPPAARFGDVREEAARLALGLIGPWQLTRAELPGEVLGTGSTAGYALFMEGYMSLEVHMVRGNINPLTDNSFFQT